MCGESSCNVFLLLFMLLRVPISAMFCKRAVLMRWHAFMFLGLRFFPLFVIPAPFREAAVLTPFMPFRVFMD
jgi:hypothetical protein